MVFASSIIPSNFNPRSPRGERRHRRSESQTSATISIHAPREGSDRTLPLRLTPLSHFNPRSPRGERPASLSVTPESTDFNPRSPRGERLGLYGCFAAYNEFQSTLPARGATRANEVDDVAGVISIHAPREGSDAIGPSVIPPIRYFNPRSPRGERPFANHLTTLLMGFQSTLPARGATCQCQLEAAFFVFQSTLPARGATHIAGAFVTMARRFQSTLPARGATRRPPAQPRHRCISIHAPREGSDAGVSPRRSGEMISIHAPREGSDALIADVCSETPYFNPRSPRGERPSVRSTVLNMRRFQSTLPARGATCVSEGIANERSFQSTLPARGATQSEPEQSGVMRFQSTLPARGATCRLLACHNLGIFQSTLPARGATSAQPLHTTYTAISIHAPREGSDYIASRNLQAVRDFNPRSPRGERPSAAASRSGSASISIHAPREGSDLLPTVPQAWRRNFNPRSPRGERQRAGSRNLKFAKFQSTLPARGATQRNDLLLRGILEFQSTLPARGATPARTRTRGHCADFNPRSPRGERHTCA